MRRLTLITLAALLTSGSIAEAARPNTLDMTCAEAAATVARAGAIVLSTGVHTYDRFVATGAYCLPLETTERALAPTIDTPYCQVGYRCKQRERYLFRD